jgi:hypothetical protein
MNTKVTHTIVFIFIIFSAQSQENSKVHEIELTLISQINQGNSYITFPTDIGNIEPLWFEGNVIPNFFLRQSKNSRLMGVLTPQIIIRMYQEESFPVRTPSYIPQITLYYQMNKEKTSKATTVFGRIAHHSNGQEEPFFLDDGSINTKSGDFSTNFFEPGFIRTNFSKRLNAYQFFKTSLEIHPQNWSVEELEGIYSNVRWHNSFSAFKLSDEKLKQIHKPANISVKAETTWHFGDINNWSSTNFNRLDFSLTFYYHPRFLEDIGLFVQYYNGADYYNIYFSHQLSVLRFGFMTDKLRF